MNSLAVFLCAILAVTSGSYIGGTSVLQGPSSSSQLVGPDGSAIVAGAPGGSVTTNEAVGYTASGVFPAPVFAKTIVPAPVVPKTIIPAPVVAKTFVPLPVSAKIVVAPQFIPKSIYTTYSSATFLPAPAPVLAPTYAAPGFFAKAYLRSPVTAGGYAVLAPGSGIEGRYIPDATENLYDDGSYKPEINEKLYDDGSYKGELTW